MRHPTVQLLRALSVVILLAFAPAPVWAAVIYDNGGPAGGRAFFSDPSIFGQFQIADDFLLSPASTTIADVHWWGVYAFSNTPRTDDFTISIYAEDGSSGLPGATVAARHAGGAERTLVDTAFGLDLYEYSAVVDPITLTASVIYWLSIVNDTTTDTDDDWAWASSSYPGGDHALKQVIPSPEGSIPLDWQFDLGNAAFNLTNDQVPEPSTLVLLATGVVGLSALRQKRRTRG